jgi:hypothetical protein
VSAIHFAQLPLDRLKIEDAKPIFVFDDETELPSSNPPIDGTVYRAALTL